jgi:tetratricopeptide (TPR) repeat protein
LQKKERNKVKIEDPSPKEIKALVNSFKGIKQHLKIIEDKDTKYDIEAAIVSIENLNEDGTTEWRDKFVYFSQKVIELSSKYIKECDLLNIRINWGVYLYNQRLYHLAEQSFLSSMRDVQAKKGTSKSKYNIYIADILNNLGLIHCSLNRFYEAEEEYKNALNEFRILHQEDSNTYSHNIATIHNNLGLLYATLHRFKDAEESYMRALDVYNDLSSTNSLLYEKHVAMVLNNLANLHNRYNLPDVAETEYKKALEIYRKLSKDDSQFLSDTAMTLHNLAALYDTQKKYQEAEKNMQKHSLYIANYQKTIPMNTWTIWPHVLME